MSPYAHVHASTAAIEVHAIRINAIGGTRIIGAPTSDHFNYAILAVAVARKGQFKW